MVLREIRTVYSKSQIEHNTQIVLCGLWTEVDNRAVWLLFVIISAFALINGRLKHFKLNNVT